MYCGDEPSCWRISLAVVSVSPAHKGYWHNPASGDLIKETTFKVSVFVQPSDLERHGKAIEQLILRFGRETGQGEVLVRTGR